MLDNTILVKTAAGRLEIDERKLKVGARQRMVLISINGERTIESIRKQFVAINDISVLLDELMSLGLIEIAESALALETGAAAAMPDFSPPGQPAVQPVAKPVAKPIVKPVAQVHAAKGDGYVQAREYMSRVLSAKVGLRAFLFTQKVDKSDSAEALRELLPEFRRLLRKSLDAGRVAEFSAHAEELIG
ncbi:MAG: hypothetical protein IPP82_00640 [Xanthomonadales bacterium]|nr:hypothetical protein [Xanthomonadales bacterium]